MKMWNPPSPSTCAESTVDRWLRRTGCGNRRTSDTGLKTSEVRSRKSGVLGLAALLALLAFSYCGEAAQAAVDKPRIDCAKIRGVCYGVKDEATVRRELAYGSRVGLNTVRFWLDRRAFAVSGDKYVGKVVDFVRVYEVVTE